MENPIVKKQSTISSREIANLTGKRHDNVLRDIRSAEPAWEKTTNLKFEVSNYRDSTGREIVEYLLTKRESLYIISKYDDETRAKLILRWEELETQNIAKAKSEITGTEFFLDKMLKPVKQQVIFKKRYLSHYGLCRLTGRRATHLFAALEYIRSTPGQTSIIPVGAKGELFLDEYATRIFLEACQKPKAKQLLSMFQPAKQLQS